MAYKDGMLAVAKVLKVIAVGLAAISVFGYGAGGDILIGVMTGTFFFLLFWTPAWLIKKFVQ